MVRTTPTFVQDMYFEAVRAALADPLISRSVRRQALLHFWRAIAVEGMAKGRFAWGLAWARKIRAACSVGAASILIAGVRGALATLAGLVLRKALKGFARRNHLKVLHER